MAKDKTSFVLYSDYKEIFNALSDEDAGKLIKHILSYVNDENPTTDSPSVNLAFIPIKLQLKRDLKKFEQTRERRSEAGRIGGLKSSQAKSSNAKQSQANQADNVNDNVTVNVTDTVNDNDTLENRYIFFEGSVKNSLLGEDQEMVSHFIEYWTEKNIKGKKMRFEMEKVFDIKRRFGTWKRNNFGNVKKLTPASKIESVLTAYEQVKENDKLANYNG